MEIEKLQHYRHQVEIAIWLLIIATAAIVNLTATPIIVNNQNILNNLLLVTAAFTFIYYRIFFPHFQNQLVVLTTTIAFTGIIAATVHYSGSLTGIFFPLLFVPLMVSATMLGTAAFLVVVFSELGFIAYETYFFQLELLTFLNYRHQYLTNIGALLLVTIFCYLGLTEFFRRESERHKIEELADELSRRKKQDEAILGSIGDGVFAVDKDLKIVLFNQAAEELTGWKAAEVLGKTCREIFQFRDKNDRPVCQQAATCLAQKCFRTERVFSEEPLRAIRPDGGESVLSETTSPVKNHHGVITGAVSILKDVSERSRLEEMKVDFVSLVSHQLRTPISAVKGYLAPLIEGRTGQLTDEQKLYLERAYTSNERQLNIIESLLNISRIEKGKIELTPIEFSLVELVKETATNFAKKAHEKGLGLEIMEPQIKIPLVTADREKIREVLENLLSNAIKFTTKGGITISFEQTKNEVVVAVADTGIGIPATAIEKLFTKFYRVGQSPMIESEGTGLGLYIAKSLVELHQGKIWVESEVGKGSTFYFSLPAK
jgi:PAS domain S-box-containing protein